MTQHEPNTQGASWDELQYEILEDYIREAEMSYALHNGKDAAYYERMRGHFEKLKAYVSKERAEGERTLLGRIIRVTDSMRGNYGKDADMVLTALIHDFQARLPADNTETL